MAGDLPVKYEEHLLPDNTTWLMRVLAATGQLRVAAIPAPIDTVKRPEVVPVDFEPWLAWELSVDLWLDNWSEQQLRWLLANSLRLHASKGALDTIAEYVGLVGGTVKGAIRPPAKTYLMPKLTAAERQKYLDRFPQLRVYPYVARVDLPWLCFVGSAEQNQNGKFVGHSFATNADAGGRWTRTATLYDHGIETTLTVRQVVGVKFGETVRTYDEISLPPRPGSEFFLNSPAKAHIYLGRLDPVDARTIRIPRDGGLELIENKAIYTTLDPGLDMIEQYPEHVFTDHQAMVGSVFPRRGQLLARAYLPPSIAWRYIYERWYLLDPTRVPDTRKRSVHIGHTRLGIAPFTAELKVEIFGHLDPRYVQRWVWGFLRPKGTSDALPRAMAAVQRSMALRDQILINTKVLRVVQVSDAVMCDGSTYIGAMIEG